MTHSEPTTGRQLLLLGETAAWCREHVASGEDWAVGLRRCTLLLTEENRGPDQFAGASGGDAAAAEVAFAGLANAEVRRGQRLRAADVSAAVWRLPKPCRAVVSGPGGSTRRRGRCLPPSWTRTTLPSSPRRADGLEL